MEQTLLVEKENYARQFQSQIKTKFTNNLQQNELSGTSVCLLPHGWMGLWKLLLRSQRKCWKLLFEICYLQKEMLATYLLEIDSPINGRPLIPISDDVNSMEALTPNNFLLGRSNLNVNIPISQDNVSNFCTNWKFIQDMLSVFWKQWIADYLPLLVQRKNWNVNTQNFHFVDLVVTADKNLSHLNWPLGRIIEIFSTVDNVVRVAKVKASQGVYTTNCKFMFIGKSGLNDFATDNWVHQPVEFVLTLKIDVKMCWYVLSFCLDGLLTGVGVLRPTKKSIDTS